MVRIVVRNLSDDMQESFIGNKKMNVRNRFNNLINSGQPILIDFYADWCLPCRLMSPVLKEVKYQFKENLRFFKVNVDHHPEIASSCHIQNVPAIVVFQEGKIQWNGIGFQEVVDISIALREIL